MRKVVKLGNDFPQQTTPEVENFPKNLWVATGPGYQVTSFPLPGCEVTRNEFSRVGLGLGIPKKKRKPNFENTYIYI